MNTLARFVAVAVLAGAVGAAASVAAAHPSIDIVASNWTFTPSTIELHVGEATSLRLTSAQGVHGLASRALGIPLTTIQPGQWATIVVTPKTAGTYVLHCAIVCGAGHPNMTLTVNVVR